MPTPVAKPDDWAMGWEMVSAIGTIAAVVVALWLAGRDARERAEHQRAQARVWSKAFTFRARRLAELTATAATRAHVLDQYEGPPEAYQVLARDIREYAAWPSDDDLAKLAGVLPLAAEHLALARETIATAAEDADSAVLERGDRRRKHMRETNRLLQGASDELCKAADATVVR